MALKKLPSRSSKTPPRAAPSSARKSAAKLAPKAAAKPRARPKAQSVKSKTAAKPVAKTAAKRVSAARKAPAKAVSASRKAPARPVPAVRKAPAKPVRATRKAVPKPRLPAARKTAARPAAKARHGALPTIAPERELATGIVNAALDVKAEAIMLFDMQKQSSITDFVLLCSGRSQGHVRGIADKIEQQLKARQIRPLSIEGYQEGSWIVMDYSDVIVHVFHPETRLHYDLESLLKHFPREVAAPSGAASSRPERSP